jgi:hypothetical protein
MGMNKKIVNYTHTALYVAGLKLPREEFRILYKIIHSISIEWDKYNTTKYGGIYDVCHYINHEDDLTRGCQSCEFKDHNKTSKCSQMYLTYLIGRVIYER